jgi:hypothetical protein
MHFTTGVRLRELRAIAIVIANLTGLPLPDRNAKREFPFLMAWYRKYWCVIVPRLPLIQLRDEFDVPIDARREAAERTV